MGVTITGDNNKNEIIQGNRSEIIVNALGGNDVIVLNLVGNLGGGNFVDAGSGDDIVDNRTEGGNDIRLGANNDRYFGQGFALSSEGFDRVLGGAGNDTMKVVTFHSQYFGEADNDTFVSEGWQNFFDGGAGIDTLSYELRDESSVLGDSGVTVQLDQGFANTGSTRIEDFVSIENVTGTNVSDVLFGSSVANIIKGRGGNDQIVGRAGNDTLDGGAGGDEMIGGAGNDTYLVDNAGDIVDELNDLGSGIDTVKSSISFSLVQSARVGGVVENLTLVGSGAINAAGNSSANILTGNAANNVLNGGTNADTMIGGAGNDTYVVENANDIVNETANGGAGLDTVQSLLTFSLVASTKVLGTVEKLTLIGTSAVNATGNAGVNTLTGNVGNNVLNGGANADTMIGGAGNDTYLVDNINDIVNETANGGAGTDTVKSAISFSLAASSKVIGTFENLVLTGSAAINATGTGGANVLVGNSAINTLNTGANNDALNGSLGNDVLTGGIGADKFVFNTALNATTNVDRITDFAVIDDTIHLDNAIFTAISGTGTLTAAQFVKNTTGLAGDSNDRIVYETDTGKLFYDSNGNATGGSVQFATLAANLVLTNADFFVI